MPTGSNTRMVYCLDGATRMVDLDAGQSWRLEELRVYPDEGETAGKSLHLTPDGRWVMGLEDDGVFFERRAADLCRELIGSGGLYDLPDELRAAFDGFPAMPPPGELVPPTPPIVLGDTANDPHIVINVVVTEPLRLSDYSVLAAMVREYPGRLPGSAVADRSGYPGAVGILRRILGRRPHRVAVSPPGGRWGAGWGLRWPDARTIIGSN